MKNIKEYIESGILEEYCLGLLSAEDQAYLIQMAMLYPEIKEELEAIELAMEKLATANAVEPAPGIKERILAELGLTATETSLNLTGLPAIDSNTDYCAWLNKIDAVIPEELAEDFVCHIIRKDDHIQQMLVITQIDINEEEHSDYLESFLILEGHCECTVGDNLFNLSAGDFLEIPLHIKHNIKITSFHVMAILQYQFV